MNSHDEVGEENPLATHAVPTLYLHTIIILLYFCKPNNYKVNVMSMRIANAGISTTYREYFARPREAFPVFRQFFAGGSV